MSLERLIAENPKFHTYKGNATSWAVHPDTLRFLHAQMTPGMSTLETGCGQTTVVFALARTIHTCITPSREEAGRIRAYCREQGIKLDVRFLLRGSETALPCSRDLPRQLDVVFIDGAHRFPIPILDWHYTASRLRVGGLVAVDDYRMPSVKILFDFLQSEREWSLRRIVQNTAFFSKVCELRIDMEDDWQHQQMNRAFRDRAFPPERPAGGTLGAILQKWRTIAGRIKGS